MGYFLEDRFFDDIQDVIEELMDGGATKEEIIGTKIMETDLEPVMQKPLEAADIVEWISNRYEDRSDEDGNCWYKLEDVLNKNINFEKLNEELQKVKLYYPADREYVITEKDFE